VNKAFGGCETPPKLFIRSGLLDGRSRWRTVFWNSGDGVVDKGKAVLEVEVTETDEVVACCIDFD